MKYVWTTITVDNMDESLKFYEGIVGLEIHSRSAAGPGPEISFLGSGDTEIELLCTGQPVKARNPGVSLGFQVESLEETIQMLKERGITSMTQVVQPNPHVKFFFIKDPNGIEIQFVEKL